MKRKLVAALLALCCILPAGLPVLAKTAPVFSGQFETNVYATAYAYNLFNPNSPSNYINEAYCSINELRLPSESGKLYRVIDPSALTENKQFSLSSLKTTDNAYLVKSLKPAAASMRNGSLPSFAVRLTDNAVLDKLTLGFSVSYRAAKDCELSVVEAGVTEPTIETLQVKQGAKITMNAKLTVDYDSLVRMEFQPNYNTEMDSLRQNDYPAGVSGDVMIPVTDGDSDYTWESLVQICAEVDLGSASLSGTPKLTTIWRDTALSRAFSKNYAFIRSFANCTVNGTVRLRLTNPFTTFAGEETIPHEQVIIYEYANGVLRDVTDQFGYGKDANGYGAFTTTTGHLGTYILSDVKMPSE